MREREGTLSGSAVLLRASVEVEGGGVHIGGGIRRTVYGLKEQWDLVSP